jgi:hypothetical protein
MPSVISDLVLAWLTVALPANLLFAVLTITPRPRTDDALALPDNCLFVMLANCTDALARSCVAFDGWMVIHIVSSAVARGCVVLASATKKFITIPLTFVLDCVTREVLISGAVCLFIAAR